MTFVNERQTPKERRTKYNFLKMSGLSTDNSIRMRDWTMLHILLFLRGWK